VKRFIRWTAEYPWIVLGAVALITIGCLIGLPKLRVNSDFETYIDHDDPAYIASKRAEERFGSSDVLMIALVVDDGIYRPSTLRAIEELTSRLEALPGVDEVQSPLNAQLIEATEDSLKVGPVAPGEKAPETPDEIDALRRRIASSQTLQNVVISEDGQAASLLVTYTTDADNIVLTRLITDIVNDYREEAAITISGLHFMSQSLSESMAADLSVLLPVVIIVIICVLYASFRTFRGVLLPLAVVVLSLIWVFGIMGWLSIPVTAVSFILPVLLLAIGIAYGIHILNHHREACVNGVGRRDALIHALTSVFTPVVMTGLTTVAGFLALLTSFMPVMAEFGLFAGIGVAIAMTLSLTLIPALLSILPLPKPRKERTRRFSLERSLRRHGFWVAKHKRGILITSALLLLAFAAGIPFMPIDSSTAAFLGENHPAVQGMDVMGTHFSGSEQIVIEIDTGRRNGLREPGILREMQALEAHLADLGVRKTISLTNIVTDLNQKFHSNDPAYAVVPDDQALIAQLLLLFSFQGGDLGGLALGDFSAGEIIGFYPRANQQELGRFVSAVQNYLETELPEGMAGEMVGSTRVSHRMTTQLVKSQMLSLATSVVVAAAIVAILMGSVVAGLVAVVPLVFAILINFGMMGFAGMTLNVATAMISSITIGIGIDYAIHFISRYRAEAQRSHDAGTVIAATTTTSGRAILFNAAAVVAGFLVLLFSVFSAFKSFGGLVSLAMVVSSLSAMTVIPALFAFKEPRFLRREPRRKPTSDLPSSPDLVSHELRTRQEDLMKKQVAAWMFAAMLVLCAGVVMATTADEILEEMENVFSVNAEDAGGVLATMAIHNEYAGGVESEYALAMFELTELDPSMPEAGDETSHVIMYFLGGDEHGSIFLMETPEDESVDSRMWLYLPALGLTKELVSEEDQSGSFAGSSMSYGDLGGTREFQEDYDATILREEQISIAGAAEDVWVLELIAKPETDTDNARVLLWVAKEDYLTLRMEAYNDLDSLDSTMEFQQLGVFEGNRIPEIVSSENLADDTRTMITVSNTRRPDVALTLDLFDPANLGALDPVDFGF